MRIFVKEREGTPVTYEERLYIADQIAKLEEYMQDAQAIKKNVASCINDYGSWDVEIELLCVDRDIYMMKRTLETGRVIII